ncbi:ATP-binding protein [Phyllobacterium zundukense]|uniref:histidine kinase n=1 Tax=Phyllobacterium zundukense TaxID=1867719 RepID=A0A2N9VXI3_9HYPH|nr:ATP-binding protein [Phyllobacterium zundukense]ATU95577.1 two-component sensor histidine kinase [Phyllobacterium zundukense]PIO44201.1 two-component sensor histidine kinase [Phyllobacterium zundukense]
MSATAVFHQLRLWPRTLGSRLFLILLAGVTIAHGLSFGVLFLERYMTAKAVMLGTLENDVATSIAILDRLPAGERPDWLARLDRGTYRYVLGPGLPGVPDMTARGAEIAAKIREASGQRFPLRVESIPGDGKRLQAHLTLSDGNPLTIDVRPGIMPVAEWLPYVLFAQLILLVLCSWFAVRLAIRPLVDLANAADALDPNKKTPRLSETGPSEVAYAATAFNSMRDRIAQYLEERVQILAAISHDLQTPITRMKLRAEFADDSAEKEKLVHDLAEIERLVHEGIAYARSAHGNTEKSSRIDVGSFIESLAYDYQDTGKAVTVGEKIDGAIVTRPHALRRILTNLIDNALKFGGTAEIFVQRDAEGSVIIKVLDRGPGIPEDQFEAVMQPFFRLEQSRNRGTGGTGLGLAIAHQLALAIGGTLKLCNRQGGGLSAEISIPS